MNLRGLFGGKKAEVGVPALNLTDYLRAEIGRDTPLLDKSSLSATELSQLNNLNRNLGLLEILTDGSLNSNAARLMREIAASDAARRCTLLPQLRVYTDSNVMQFLIVLLQRDPEASVRKAAASTVAYYRDPEVTAALREAYLNDRSALVQELCIYALRPHESEADQLLLIERFPKANDRLRRSTLELLVGAKDSKRVQAFLGKAKNFTKAEQGFLAGN